MRSVRCRNDGVNRRSNCRNFGGTDTGGYPHGKMIEKNFHPGGEAPPLEHFRTSVWCKGTPACVRTGRRNRGLETGLFRFVDACPSD